MSSMNKDLHERNLYEKGVK
ncbi:Protein of unknown function [Bacillus cereus]|nr:Protein of unknown function [Bacillus cereus]